MPKLNNNVHGIPWAYCAFPLCVALIALLVAALYITQNLLRLRTRSRQHNGWADSPTVLAWFHLHHAWGNSIVVVQG
jgi:hypothetical protein